MEQLWKNWFGEEMLPACFGSLVQVTQQYNFAPMQFCSRMKLPVSEQLNLDVGTKEEIEIFCRNATRPQVNAVSPFLKQIATALICQLKMVSNVAKDSETSIKVRTEQVFKLIEPVASKGVFLGAFENYLSQMDSTSSRLEFLKCRVKQLRIAYSLFQKYQRVCHRLLEEARVYSPARGSLLAIFWLTYVLLKNQARASGETQCTEILIGLLQTIFSKFLIGITSSTIKDAIASEFNQIVPQLLESNLSRVTSIFEEIYQLRSKGENMPFHPQLIQDQQYLSRFLDDLYAIFSQRYPDPILDESFFLPIPKDLPPKAYLTENDDENMTAEQRLQFSSEEDKDKEDDDMARNLTMVSNSTVCRQLEKRTEISPIVVRVRPGITPLICRLDNLGWANKCISHVGAEEFAQVEQIYGQVRNGSYEQFCREARKIISASISSFAPACLSKERRVEEIFRMFVYFVIRIMHEYSTTTSDSYKLIFDCEESFLAVLCLTTNLFNYAYHARAADYSQYAQLFHVSPRSYFKFINWFGRKTEIPVELSKYLYLAERQILLEDFWTGSEGFQIITRLEEDRAFLDNFILKRLRRHIKDFVVQLCSELLQLLGNDKIQTKVYEKVIYMLQKQQNEFRSKNVRQVISEVLLRERDGKRKINVEELPESLQSKSQYRQRGLMYGKIREIASKGIQF